MKKKDEIILTIEDVLFPNKAYGFLDGERVIVKNTIPGQKVRATVCKKRSSGIEAQLNEILEHSGASGRNLFSLYALRRVYLSDPAP